MNLVERCGRTSPPICQPYVTLAHVRCESLHTTTRCAANAHPATRPEASSSHDPYQPYKLPPKMASAPTITSAEWSSRSNDEKREAVEKNLWRWNLACVRARTCATAVVGPSTDHASARAVCAIAAVVSISPDLTFPPHSMGILHLVQAVSSHSAHRCRAICGPNPKASSTRTTLT